MKQIYRPLILLLLLSISTTGWSQKMTETSGAQYHYTHIIDSLLQHVSKSRVPAGILYDRALPAAMLHAFSETDTSSSEHFKQAYQDLYSAAYDKSTMLNPMQMERHAYIDPKFGVIKLGVIDYTFGVLDTLAIDKGTLEVRNGLYYDASSGLIPIELPKVTSPILPKVTPPVSPFDASFGTSSFIPYVPYIPYWRRSPFLTRNVTIATTLVESTTRGATLALSSELCFGNKGRQVTGITITINDGYSRYCDIDKAIDVQFSTPGVRVLRYNIHFSDGSTAQASSIINVLPAEDDNRKANFEKHIISRSEFTNYEGTESIAGEGNAGFWLHNPASVADYARGREQYLRQPIIVLDGIDDGDGRGLKEIYEKELSGLTALIDKQASPENSANRDLIILNFPKNERKVTAVVGGLHSRQYVDGGDDYIERNALALIELINKLKPLLNDPNEKFTIIGPSMGGMVSRYALAYMEKEYARTGDPYYYHQTDTWISFDAPHQGANVPIGVQAYLKYFSFLKKAETMYDGFLLSPASKQMLLTHVLAGEYSNQGAPGYRDRFMLALRDNGLPGSLGYPVNLRRIALANGSLRGVKRAESPGSTALVMVGTINRLYNFPLFFAPKSTREFLRSNIYFSPSANTSGKVFDAQFHLASLGFGSQKFFPMFKDSHIASSAGHGSFDLAPGGYYDAQLRVKMSGEEKGFWTNGWASPTKLKFEDVKDFHSFISVASALGYDYQSLSNYQGTTSLPSPYQNLANKDLRCNNLTPFDAYYAPQNENTKHVTLSDPGMQQFLGTELFRITPPPVFITDAASICSGASVQFSVAQECSRRDLNGNELFPIIYNWTSSDPGIQIISGQDPAVVTVKSQSGFQGRAIISVTAQRAGFSVSAPVTRSIVSGDSFVRVESPVDVFCPGTTIIFTLDSRNTVDQPNWDVYMNGQLRNDLIAYTPYDGLAVLSYEVGNIEVVASVTDACSGQLVMASGYAKTVNRIGGRPCPMYKQAAPEIEIYPNPADSNVKISSLLQDNDFSSSAKSTDKFDILIYDWNGRTVYNGKTVDGQLKINTQKLETGLYNVRIIRGKEVINRHLSIQH